MDSPPLRVWLSISEDGEIVVVGCKRSRDEVRDPSEVPFHAQQSPMPSEKPELDPFNSFLPLFLLLHQHQPPTCNHAPVS
jgi:hypothetical protein